MGITNLLRQMLEGLAGLSGPQDNGTRPTPIAEREVIEARSARIKELLKEQLGEKTTP